MPAPKRLRQNLGLIIGILMGGLALVVLLVPDLESLHARGPLAGHPCSTGSHVNAAGWLPYLQLFLL